MSSFKPTIDRLETFIFWSRWLQAPLYLGLIIAQCAYVYLFMLELWHLIHNLFFSSTRITETEVMLVVLGLIDVVMIANLLIMVIIGGYETFVSRLDLEGHPDQPEWLSHVNAGVLKSEHTIKWQVVIHTVFLLSALAMAWVDRLMTTTVTLSKPSHGARH